MCTSRISGEFYPLFIWVGYAILTSFDRSRSNNQWYTVSLCYSMLCLWEFLQLINEFFFANGSFLHLFIVLYAKKYSMTFEVETISKPKSFSSGGIRTRVPLIWVSARLPLRLFGPIIDITLHQVSIGIFLFGKFIIKKLWKKLFFFHPNLTRTVDIWFRIRFHNLHAGPIQKRKETAITTGSSLGCRNKWNLLIKPQALRSESVQCQHRKWTTDDELRASKLGKVKIASFERSRHDASWFFVHLPEEESDALGPYRLASGFKPVIGGQIFHVELYDGDDDDRMNCGLQLERGII